MAVAAVDVREPIAVVVGHETRELTAGILLLHPQDLGHPGIAGGGQFEVPMHQPLVDVLPILPVEPVHQAHAQFAELPLVVAHGLLTDQPLLIEDLLEGKQDLVRVQRLDQVIRHLGTDGLLHDVLLLALGDHHAGQVGTLVLDTLQCFEAGQARHVLIEEDDVDDAVAVQGLDQGGAIGEARDLVSLALKEQDVGLQEVDLIVGPEDVGSARHECFNGEWSQLFCATGTNAKKGAIFRPWQHDPNCSTTRSTDSSNCATRTSRMSWTTRGSSGCAGSASWA